MFPDQLELWAQLAQLELWAQPDLKVRPEDQPARKDQWDRLALVEVRKVRKE
jgi:hypothetical protein